MKLSENVVRFPRREPSRSRQDLAFLPAALEIVETPPSPTGRAIAWTIVSFFCLALAWGGFGTLDIVASAPGKIIPSGRTKVVQPFEAGVVRAIHVRDGQTVARGDVLIELDPTMNDADRDHLKSDLMSALLDVARLKVAATDAPDPLADFQPPADASPALVAAQRRYLVAQTAEHRAKTAALEQQERQKTAERGSIAATIEKIEAIIPVLQERTEIYKTLYDRQTGSKVTYLESLRMLVENEKELLVQKSRLKEAEAAIAVANESRQQTEAEYRRGLSSDLAEAERKAAGLSHDLDKANEKTRLQLLVAPVDGIVQQLAVHTVGGVVTPAQALLAVVPIDSRLEIEAMVNNRDIGFVHAGQEAEIKVDTFNFTRYGLIKGRVLSVSSDAITHDKPADKSDDAAHATEQSSSEPKGQELVYSARISLEQGQMRVDDQVVNLSPGMAVTAEIRTGSRSILSYFLSPILRYGHDMLRER